MRLRKGVFLLLLWGLAACSTPMVQPFLERTSQVEITDEHLRVGDGTELPLRSWLPTNDPSAVIVALHGFNDYSKAFESAGQFFRARGIALYAYDQRGFGANEEHRGIWGGQENLTTDAREMVQALREKYGEEMPIYLMGESMGGAVVINTMIGETPPDVEGIILSAPAVWGDETMNSFYRSTLWLLAHTFPDECLSGEGLDIIASDNFPMLREMAEDPLVIKKTRVDAVYGIVQLMDTAYQGLERVQVPVLLLYGEKDQVIPKQPIAHAVKKLKAPYTLALYPDGYHMLLRDLKGEVVLYDTSQWIANRYRPLPSGYDMGWQDFMALK